VKPKGWEGLEERLQLRDAVVHRYANARECSMEVCRIRWPKADYRRVCALAAELRAASPGLEHTGVDSQGAAGRWSLLRAVNAMVGHKPGRSEKQYTAEEGREALYATIRGELSLAAASMAHGVPLRTLETWRTRLRKAVGLDAGASLAVVDRDVLAAAVGNLNIGRPGADPLLSPAEAVVLTSTVLTHTDAGLNQERALVGAFTDTVLREVEEQAEPGGKRRKTGAQTSRSVLADMAERAERCPGAARWRQPSAPRLPSAAWSAPRRAACREQVGRAPRSRRHTSYLPYGWRRCTLRSSSSSGGTSRPTTRRGASCAATARWTSLSCSA
jgi:transposase-like protein